MGASNLKLGDDQRRVIFILVYVPFQFGSPVHQPLEKDLTFVDSFLLSCGIKAMFLMCESLTWGFCAPFLR